MLMGVIHLPQIHLYWSRACSVRLVSDSMTRNRFYELRNHLHSVNSAAPTEEQKKDKLFLVRPILKAFSAACLALPWTQKLAIDEQMIPFSGRCAMRQYVPSKPNPVGLKNFMLAAPDGLVLDYMIYTGKNTLPEEDIKGYGLGGAVVKRLVQSLAVDLQEQPTLLFTDRCFTGIRIIELLAERNIPLTRTVVANRTDGAALTFPKDKEMSRGASVQKVREDGKIGLVKWKDNKSVLMMSSAYGIHPEGTCKRWSKEEHKKVDVTRPAIVAEYNVNMGGIDLMDRYISYYRILLRTKKWTVRLFAHFLDMAVCNAWVEYLRDFELYAREGKKLSLIDLKTYVAEALIRANTSREVGDTSRTTTNDQKGTTKVVPIPNNDVRLDGFNHFPDHVKLNNPVKCRNFGCTGKTRVKCMKCNLFLCLQSRNCFLNFHRK